MILKASQRSGARQLAAHLLRTDENEHVEIHEIRGFMAADLTGALQEAQATSRGTRCRQFLFSLSLNPPDDVNVPESVFEQAVGRIEDRLGLEGQPRVIVFHEKQGRRHAHCVWSRIDTEQMKAINLPYFKTKLNDIGKQIYLEQGWDLPRGFIDKKYSDPLNFTREEWQQALRTGRDPKMTKAVLQQCWKVSDSRAAFGQALKDHGFRLARGDRRGFVAVDWQGEVYALPRATGVKAKEIKARLGDPGLLPPVTEAKVMMAKELAPTLRRHVEDLAKDHAKELTPLMEQAQHMAGQHRTERQTQRMIQQQRWQAETARRAERLRKGLKGIWDRLTGRYQKTRKQNEIEAQAAEQRDREQRTKLRQKQLGDRRTLQQQINHHKSKQQQALFELTRDIATCAEKDELAVYERQYRRTITQERQRTLARLKERKKDQSKNKNKSGGFEPGR